MMTKPLIIILVKTRNVKKIKFIIIHYMVNQTVSLKRLSDKRSRLVVII